MEHYELERFALLAENNPEVKYLLQRHQKLEGDLGRLESIRNPTESERREITKIKRLKLRGKDRLQELAPAT